MKPMYDMAFAESRLLSTYLIVDGVVQYVQSVYSNRGEICLLLTDRMGKETRLPHTSDRISNAIPRVGWMTAGEDKLFFQWRTGRRHWKIGTRCPRGSWNNFPVAFGNQTELLTVLSPNWAVFKEKLMFKGFHVADMVGDFPLFKEDKALFRELFYLEVAQNEPV